MRAPKITVVDTYPILKPLFTSRDKPKVVLERASEVIISPTGAFGQWQQQAGQARFKGSFEVYEFAQTDAALIFGKQVMGLFNPTRKREFSDWEFEQWEVTGFLGQIKEKLEYILSQLPNLAEPLDLTVLTQASDPTSFDYMLGCNGLSCFAGAKGFLTLRMLPTTGNMNRLGAILARAVVQNLRWQYTHQAPVTVGDYEVMEGLAASFAKELFPDTPSDPWLYSFYRPADWPEVLAKVASFYGLTDYEKVPTNYFGNKEDANNFWLLPLRPMNDEERYYATIAIGESLAYTHTQTIAAQLYGDAIMDRQGHPTIGLSDYAGFEMGYLIVQDHLKRTGQNIASSLLLPTEDFMQTFKAS